MYTKVHLFYEEALLLAPHAPSTLGAPRLKCSKPNVWLGMVVGRMGMEIEKGGRGDLVNNNYVFG